jgi:hypothetical protein
MVIGPFDPVACAATASPAPGGQAAARGEVVPADRVASPLSATSGRETAYGPGKTFGPAAVHDGSPRTDHVSRRGGVKQKMGTAGGRWRAGLVVRLPADAARQGGAAGADAGRRAVGGARCERPLGPRTAHFEERLKPQAPSAAEPDIFFRRLAATRTGPCAAVPWPVIWATGGSCPLSRNPVPGVTER